MASEGNGQQIDYRVVLSALVKQQVIQIHQEKIDIGEGQEFLGSIRQIYERLRTKPLDFGEPLYHLPALDLVVHQAVQKGIVVNFAIHMNKPIVLVRGLIVLS